MYREQDYVERCQCGEPATAPCSACGRARCGRHLAKALCNRCTQAIARELDQRSGKRWLTSGIVGAGTAVFLMMTPLVLFAVVGLPIGVATFFLLRVWQRATLVRTMGPALAASKGELLPAPQDVPFDENPPPFRYY